MEISNPEESVASTKQTTSSVAQRTRSKKRKLFQISTTSVATRNLESIDLSSKTTGNITGDKLNNVKANIEPNIDESILNSEIYQIYWRAEDSWEAQREISAHKNCVLFETAKGHYPISLTEEGFKSICKSTLQKLWKEDSGETKFKRLKKFIDGTIKDEVLGYTWQGKSMRAILNNEFTKIQIVNPNGYEYFYVRHFKMGHHNRRFGTRHQNVYRAEWYRAVSYESGRAQRLAQLHVLGITKSTLDQLQLNHYLKKNSTNMKWSDLAHRIINGDCLRNQDCLYGGKKGLNGGQFRDCEGMFYIAVYNRLIMRHNLCHINRPC